MYFGIQVMAEIVFVLEAPFAIGAVGVHITIVALELRVTTEYLYVSQQCVAEGYICSVETATDLAARLAGVVVLVCVLP